MPVCLSMDVPTEMDVKPVELKWIYTGAVEKHKVVLDACDLGWTDETKARRNFSLAWWI